MNKSCQSASPKSDSTHSDTIWSTLVHIGAGDKPPIDEYAKSAESVFLVEPREAAFKKLQGKKEGFENVSVFKSVICDSQGEVDFIEFNLAWASGISEPSSQLFKLYPGLRQTNKQRRNAQALEDLLNKIGISGENNLLILDVNDDSMRLLDSLVKTRYFAWFSEIVVFGAPHTRMIRDIEFPAEVQKLSSLPDSISSFFADENEVICCRQHPLVTQYTDVIEALNAKNVQLKSILSKTVQDQDELKQQNQQAKAEIENLNQTLKVNDQKLKIEKERMVKQLTQQKSELKLYAAELKAEKVRADQLDAELISANAKAKEFLNINQSLKQNFTELKSEKEGAKVQLGKLKEQVDSYASKLKSEKNRIDQLLAERNKVAKLSSEAQKLNVELKRNNLELTSKRDEISMQLEATKKHLEEREKKVLEKQVENQKIKDLWQKEKEENDRRMSMVDEEMTAVEAQIEQIKDVLERDKV